MLSSTRHQGSLFYAAFGREAALIKDDLLQPIDALLEDVALIELVREAQAGRAPCSRTRGRQAIAPDRLLRCCALKHLKNWSFRQLERELRGSLVYRRFTHFDQDAIPDHSTLSRNFALVGPVATRQVHARVVKKALEERVAAGMKLRTDTTVVESNVHYPTDSSLLQDGIRVLTRAVKRIAQECPVGAVQIIDHTRSAQRRVLEIHRAAKSFSEAARQRMKGSYSGLMSLARGVVRAAERVMGDLKSRNLPVPGNFVRVLINEAQLQHFTPLVKKVLLQTKARVFGGDHHVEGKILSLFEEHTQVIRKGKAHKPTEFGRLVRIDEVENGIVSGYEIQDGNPADLTAWVPALEQHERLFGRAPRRATADRGFFSTVNEREAETRGVKQIALPARGRLSEARAALQKQGWFRRLLRWRGGIEPRIANLKHRFGMARAYYKGDSGFKRFVGWSVISQNLVSIARALSRRKARQEDDTTSKRAA
ncbi:MAG TPA: ISNCY family transposase [Anaeromyxobacteraceae bacterium]|nr:ISNCY family transposase [Anaeromyxobacteraceae bacterium]